MLEAWSMVLELGASARDCHLSPVPFVCTAALQPLHSTRQRKEALALIVAGCKRDDVLGRCLELIFQAGDHRVTAHVLLATARFAPPKYFTFCMLDDRGGARGMRCRVAPDSTFDLRTSWQVIADSLLQVHNVAGTVSNVLLTERCLAPVMPGDVGRPSLIDLVPCDWSTLGRKALLSCETEVYPAVLRRPKTAKDAETHLKAGGDPLQQSLADASSDLREAVRKWERRIGGAHVAGTSRGRPKAPVDDGAEFAPEVESDPEVAAEDVEETEPWEAELLERVGVPAHSTSSSDVRQDLPVGGGLDSAERVLRELSSGSGDPVVYRAEPVGSPPLPPPTEEPPPEELPPPIPAAPPPEAGPVAAPADPVAKRARRGERAHLQFGPFSIVALHPGGEFRGLSAQCRRHAPGIGEDRDAVCKTNLTGICDLFPKSCVASNREGLKVSRPIVEVRSGVASRVACRRWGNLLLSRKVGQALA